MAWCGPNGRRSTTSEQVATLVAMLASPVLGNLTGADVVIDGERRGERRMRQSR